MKIRTLLYMTLYLDYCALVPVSGPVNDSHTETIAPWSVSLVLFDYHGCYSTISRIMVLYSGSQLDPHLGFGIHLLSGIKGLGDLIFFDGLNLTYL